MMVAFIFFRVLCSFYWLRLEALHIFYACNVDVIIFYLNHTLYAYGRSLDTNFSSCPVASLCMYYFNALHNRVLRHI